MMVLLLQIFSKGSPESLLPLCRAETIPAGTEKSITQFATAGYRYLQTTASGIPRAAAAAAAAAAAGKLS